MKVMGTKQKKKVSANCKDNEGAAMCKANDSNEGIDEGTLVLGQEKSREYR